MNDEIDSGILPYRSLQSLVNVITLMNVVQSHT